MTYHERLKKAKGGKECEALWYKKTKHNFVCVDRLGPDCVVFVFRDSPASMLLYKSVTVGGKKETMKDPDKSLCFCLTRITLLYQVTLLQTAGAQQRV